MRRLTLIATVLVIAVGSFVLASGGNRPAVAAELETFPDCRALLDRLVSSALEHVGPYGLEGTPHVMPLMEGETAVADGQADRAAQGETDAAQSGEAAQGGDVAAPAEESGYTSETGTNVQVVGVDEPDHVKLVGNTLAVIQGPHIRLLDVSSTTPQPLGRLDLSGDLHPFTMLAAGDRLVVFGNAVQTDADTAGSSERGGMDIIEPGWRDSVAVAVVDVSTPSSPRRLDHMTIDGSFVSARLTEGRVLVTTRTSPDIPFVYPSGGADAEQRAEEANREAVRQSTIDQWIAEVTFADGTNRPLADCDRVGVPSEVVSWQSVGMAAFDPGRPLSSMAAAATFGAGDTVYATSDRIYVAGHQWDQETGKASTAIHAFTTDVPPTYLASGRVEGQLLNQFAMDRFEGHLRVATTTTVPATGDTDSRVVVLTERDDQLAQVGIVTGLGRPGETIRGIRYLGPVGFVVTFEQTDPLYTVDLRNPASPRVLGELKVPGYSAYLHPTGDGRLLGVGSAAEEDGRITGVQVSLFDVSNLAAPARLDALELEGAVTPVEWDHHAFTWVAGEQLAVVPFEGHGIIGRPIPVEPDEGSDDAGTPPSGGEGDAVAPGEPLPPDHEPAPPNSGLMLIRVTDDQLVHTASVSAPTVDGGWSPGFQRSIVHDGTLLAIGAEDVWRIGFDGTIIAESNLD